MTPKKKPFNNTKAKETLTYKISRLIIGCSIESLLYAWKTQTKIVVKEPEYVFRHDRRFEDVEMSFMNASNPKELYNNLVFALSLSSLMLCPNNIASIREEDASVNIITKGNRRLVVYPDEVIYFDKATDVFNVYDFFDTREMAFTDTKRIEDLSSDFIYQLDFYKTPRSFNSKTRDLVGSSRMTHEMLLSPDYGQGISMIKILRMLKSEGITGKFAWERKGKRYYKRPRIEFYRRVVSQSLETKYTLKDINEMKQQEGAPWKMLEKLRKREGT